MEDIELNKIWEEYDRKIEESRILNLQSWVLNLRAFESIQTQKAKSKLNALATQKIWVALLGFAWVCFLVFLIVHSLEWSKIFFVVSAGAIVVFTIVAIVVYIKHVVLIREIDNSESVVEVQKKIATLRSSTLQIVRLLFLQTPFYTTWWFTTGPIINGDPKFWFISFPIVVLFTLLSVWLYRNINYKNANKKWFRILFSGSEWTSVTKAMELLNEIDEFKKDAS